MWADKEDTIWQLVAYAGHYGHQQVSESLALPTVDLKRFVDNVMKIVAKKRGVAVLDD